MAKKKARKKSTARRRKSRSTAARSRRAAPRKRRTVVKSRARRTVAKRRAAPRKRRSTVKRSALAKRRAAPKRARKNPARKTAKKLSAGQSNAALSARITKVDQKVNKVIKRQVKQGNIMAAVVGRFTQLGFVRPKGRRYFEKSADAQRRAAAELYAGSD